MIKKFTCLLVLIVSICSQVLAQGPANNECSGALPVALSSYSVGCSASIHASTSGATQSLPNPTCTSVENDDDIWYTFTATTHAVVLWFSNVVNDGTGDPAYIGLALYTSCPIPLAPGSILCNNLASAGAGYLIINGLTPGQTYYMRFWSTLTFGNTASFDFCLQEVQQPANDDCSNATAITSEPVGAVCNATYHASTIGATPSAFSPACTADFTDDDLWYSFTAHTSGVRFNWSNSKNASAFSGSSNLGYALYDAACPASTVAPVSCNANIGAGSGSALIGGLVPGHQYYLRLYSYATNHYMTLDFCLVDADLPLNDECNNAITVPVGTGFCTNPVAGDLLNATTSPGFGAPACSPLSGSIDIWFKTTIPATGNVLIQTSAVVSNINDLIMEAYSGSCGSLTLITCSDDDNPMPSPSPSDLHPAISLSGRIPGETIFLRVLGKGAINNGPFAICAWDSTVHRPISPGGNCISGNTTIINLTNLNLYMWVPLLDASGNIIAELYANGNELNAVNSSLFVNSSGTVRDVSGQYYLDRNMTIAAAGTGSTRVRFYFTDAELAALQAVQPVASLVTLKINKTTTACEPAFSGASSSITQQGNGRYDNGHYIEFATPSFSSFYIDGTTAALPLRFISFTAERQTGRIDLQWVVMKDADLKSFDVQRMDASGQYTTIAQKLQSAIAATINGGWQYTFSDHSPLTGNSFYRIKMNTYSGAVLYSTVASVRSDKRELIEIFPNPVQDYITVRSNVDIKLMTVVNAMGQVMKQINRPVVQNGIVLMDARDIPTGLYIIRVVPVTGAVKQLKMVKR